MGADRVDLEGNGLSRQFEKAIAFAIAIPTQKLEVKTFYHRLQILTKRLVDIYDAQRQGRDPLDLHQDLQTTEDQLAEVISLKKPRGKGQGRGLSALERTAVEKRAMTVAEVGLQKVGFTDIEDVSANESYDFKAKKKSVDWFIEVKGTTSSAADQFLLTAPELTLHKANVGRTALALVNQITLTRGPDGVKATGGTLIGP